jgi:hypothetical protein
VQSRVFAGEVRVEEYLSIHEMRRRAPAHFWAKADNARFVAYLLARGLSAELLAEMTAKVGYNGTPPIATAEAFWREAALALELIVKAVIAKKIELGIARKHIVKVRPTHDVPKLWDEAGLPQPSSDDQRRLLHAKRILSWSGRYAAPRTDEQYYKEVEDEDALAPQGRGGRLDRIPVLDWENFDRLYRIAIAELTRFGSI